MKSCFLMVLKDCSQQVNNIILFCIEKNKKMSIKEQRMMGNE